MIDRRLIEPRLTWSRFSGPRFQKISNINTLFIWGLVSNTTPFHRKQSRIDMEDVSNILLEKPAFNAKCLNLSTMPAKSVGTVQSSFLLNVSPPPTYNVGLRLENDKKCMLARKFCNTCLATCSSFFTTLYKGGRGLHLLEKGK